MKTFFDEFKAFAVKGNVIDLAVGVVIGTAFNKIVDSLVNDIIMQVIAAAFKQPDFSAIVFHVNGGMIKVGAFINNIISFLIIAFSVFLTIKFMNRFLIKHEEPKPQITA
jgi:large conductance mechanosensitive channel